MSVHDLKLIRDRLAPLAGQGELRKAVEILDREIRMQESGQFRCRRLGCMVKIEDCETRQAPKRYNWVPVKNPPPMDKGCVNCKQYLTERDKQNIS